MKSSEASDSQFNLKKRIKRWIKPWQLTLDMTSYSKMHAALFMSLKLTTYTYVRVQQKTEYSLDTLHIN